MKKNSITKYISSIFGNSLNKEKQNLVVKKIKVNQIGYLPNERKVFFYTENTINMDGREFEVVNLTENITCKGKLIKSITDQDSGDRIYKGDFSFIMNPGTYSIRIDGQESYLFEIHEDKYKKVFYTTMRSYYLQRCGIEINDSISGVSHLSCHTEDVILESESNNTKFEASGGWHDAGDYGRYIPTAAITVAQLLLMYELSPSTFETFSLDIPKTEKEKHLPDILAEIKYELDWMLKMQDKKDGGVYFKVSTNEFPPENMAPEDDQEICYCYSKSTAVTANFAASISIAARIYEKIDGAYSEMLKKAAILAGDFLIKTDGKILMHSTGKTGSYYDTMLRDDLLWAYAELFRLTENESYLNKINQYWIKNFSPMISWNSVTSLAWFTLINCPGISNDKKQDITGKVNSWIDIIKNQIALNGYRIALKTEEYVWGSLKTALSYGVCMVLAKEYLQRDDLEEEIKSQFDYVMGMNPLSKVYITKVGTDYVRNPHHRLVSSKGVLVPGLMVGGPNNLAQDGFYQTGLGPRGYKDLSGACSCNEYAIDYNAPLVFLAGYFLMK